MSVHDFNEQDKKETTEYLEFQIEKKNGELKAHRALLSLRDSPDIKKFIECFMVSEYQEVGVAHDKELETNKNFHLKGRAYQLRKQLNWQIALQRKIEKIKGELEELDDRLKGEKPQHEPE